MASRPGIGSTERLVAASPVSLEASQAGEGVYPPAGWAGAHHAILVRTTKIAWLVSFLRATRSRHLVALLVVRNVL